MLSCEYKFLQDNFLCSAADAVHAAYPFHLIGCFECFGYTFLLHHCRNDDCHALVAGLVDLGKVPMQRAACKQVCVEDRTLLFQIAAAHTPVLAVSERWADQLHSHHRHSQFRFCRLVHWHSRRSTPDIHPSTCFSIQYSGSQALSSPSCPLFFPRLL